MNFTVVDDKGRAVGAGKDLSTLQASLRGDTRQAVAKASGTVERTGLTAFPADGIARTRDQHRRWAPGDRLPGAGGRGQDGRSAGLHLRGRPAPGPCGRVPDGCWCSARRRRWRSCGSH